MIARINFIEKERFVATYQTMGMGIGIVLLICGMVYGFLFLNDMRLEARRNALLADIERLKAERQKIISQESALTGEGATLQIQQVLEKTPAWSDILSALAGALPARAWLASVKSADKQEPPGQKEIIINGQAKNPQAIAAFLANLEANPHFQKAVLTTSQEETDGLFQFTMTCDIGPKKWGLNP